MNMDEQQLPPGWELVTINDLCAINPKHVAGIPDETPVSFVPMAAVSDVHGRIETPEVRPYGEVKRGFTHFADGDVIFAKITPCMENGKAASVRGLVNGLGCGTTEFFVFRSNGALSQDYLFHFIRQESYRKLARAQMQSGVGQARVPREFIEDTRIPLPPLPEQRRIVTKIEALQERSGRAAKALEEVGPLLEQFRQSILAAAFSGRLTADWREKQKQRRMGIPARRSSTNEAENNSGKNAQATEEESTEYEPAHELLARIRTERRQRWEQAELAKYEAKGKQPPKDWKDKYEEPEPVDETDLPELPEGWCWAKLHELSEFITSGSRGWAEFYSSTGPLFVRAQNINTDKLLLEDVARVQPPASSEGMRTRIELGDLLITITGANVAKAASVEIDLGEAYVSQHVALVRLVAPEFCSFIHLWTVSAANGRAQLLEDAYGNGKPGLNLEHLRELRIAFPPAREQAAIVALITKALASLTLISACSNDFHECLAQLNQSVLAKAFRGELVPQDPNDEPASELLARIRREREDSGKNAQATKGKSRMGIPARRSPAKRKAPANKNSSTAAADPTLVIRVLAEGGAVNIHADTSGPTVQFYTKSSGGGLLAEIEDIPEADLKPRESKRVTNLSDLMDPELALLYPKDVNETYLPQLRDWYTWAAPQLPEHFESEFLEQAKSRWSEALQIEKSSTSQSATKAKRGRLFDA